MGEAKRRAEAIAQLKSLGKQNRNRDKPALAGFSGLIEAFKAGKL